MNTLLRATRRRRQMRLLSSLPLALFFATLLPGCAKNGLTVSPVTVPMATSTPLIIPPIHPITSQQPMQTFIATYNIPVTDNNITLGLGVAGLGDDEANPPVYDNAELGFAFRSSVAGNIIGLGILVPATGYAHTVTLWDSATQKILATAVVTESKVVFTYTSLTTSVPILANHAYVVGYNTMGAGTPLDTNTPGDWCYNVEGLLVDGGLGSDQPMMPLREGNITVENAFYNNYGDGRAPANLFPPTTSWNSLPLQSNFFGLCDIEFAVPI